MVWFAHFSHSALCGARAERARETSNNDKRNPMEADDEAGEDNDEGEGDYCATKKVDKDCAPSSRVAEAAAEHRRAARSSWLLDII